MVAVKCRCRKITICVCTMNASKQLDQHIINLKKLKTDLDYYIQVKNIENKFKIMHIDNRGRRKGIAISS